MGDRIVDAAHGFRRDDHIKVFVTPIIRRGRHRTFDLGQRAVGAHFDASVQQRLDHALANRPRHFLMDQQTFSRAANAGAAGLGVQNDFQNLLGVGVFIDIDVHDAFEVGKDRHPRFALHQTDQPLAAARDDHINRVGHGQHLAHRGAVARGHQLD